MMNAVKATRISVILAAQLPCSFKSSEDCGGYFMLPGINFPYLLIPFRNHNSIEEDC